MEYAVAVYRSRNVTMQAYNFLIKNGINAALISTPRGANVGCGLSVRFNLCDLSKVRRALTAETFVGFFLVKVTMSGTTVTRL